MLKMSRIVNLRRHFEKSSRAKVNGGKLIKPGLHYDVRYMDCSDIRQSLELQNHVVSALEKAGKNHYIIPKTELRFQRLIKEGHRLIGTFIKNSNPLKRNRLAAHMLILYPQNLKETGLADTSVLPDEKIKNISVISNVLVHDDFRGNKLMQQMLKEWLKIAESNGKKHAIAEVCVDNEFSWQVFIDCGFVIYADGHDDRDGSDLVYLHKPLKHKFIYSDDPKDTATIKLFNDQGHINNQAHKNLKHLLGKGFHVLEFNRDTKHITLVKSVGITPSKTLNKTPPLPINDNKL